MVILNPTARFLAVTMGVPRGELQRRERRSVGDEPRNVCFYNTTVTWDSDGGST